MFHFLAVFEVGLSKFASSYALRGTELRTCHLLPELKLHSRVEAESTAKLQVTAEDTTENTKKQTAHLYGVYTACTWHYSHSKMPYNKTPLNSYMGVPRSIARSKFDDLKDLCASIQESNGLVIFSWV